jgi:putative endonuclease
MFNKNFLKNPTEKQRIGEVGENFASAYLEANGYTVIERNYLKKWGEIDIIAKRKGKLHFVEVKSVTREFDSVTHVTGNYRPEDNMHPWKLQRLSRAVQSYLLDRNVSDETDWQFDLITVYLDKNKGLIKTELLEDIVL